MIPPLTGLTVAESRWLEYIWSTVTPRLLGTSDERARTAAIVSWWALKEGVLDVRPNPWRQNLCGTGGDHSIGDLETCPGGAAWQVGMAGIQPSAVMLAAVENVASQIYPGQSSSDVLRAAARDAGISDSATVNAIASSSGDLKKAWLLRDPAIAFTIQRRFVESQCIRGGYSWCYGDWDTAQRFASDAGRVREVVDALTGYFASAPSPSSATARRWLPLVLTLTILGASAYYLYSTPRGAQLRRRAEAKLRPLVAF